MVIEKRLFDNEQADKVVELGTQLRQSREEQSLSLKAISGKTKIQLRLLEAIEAGELDQLPPPVYTQGFIRRFAEALGLNGPEFASAFPIHSLHHPLRSDWTQPPAVDSP